MGDRWQIVTPEVTRPPTMGLYQGKPGEDTIGAKRASPRKSPSKRPDSKSQTRWSAFKRVLGLVPWGALLACSFVVTGLVIYLVHGKQAATRSLDVLNFVQSDDVGYPHRVHVFAGSYPVTAGLAGGCLLGSMVLAIIRLRQKLNKENKSGETWGRMKFGMLFYLGVLGFCVILLPFIWFALNSMFLCAWGMALWTLRDSTSAASINMQQMNPSANLTNINLTQPIAASNMVCPSGGCFNMNLFTWLESNMCLCNQQLLSELQDASRAALSAVVWSLGGIGCLMCGSFIAAAQGAADLALMRSDWAWADVVARMRSRSPARRAPLDMYSKDDAFALTPGEAVPKRGIYQTGGGYYIRSPHPDAM